MNCLEFRRRVGAQPHDAGEDVAAHARTCAACAQFQREMLALDQRIESALRIPVPPAAASQPARAVSRAPRFALAASVLLAAALAAVLWLANPRSSIAGDVVRHLAHESASLDLAEVLPDARLAEVSRNAGVPIDPAIGPLTYAQRCWFRGQWVPHLVIRDASGPVTVLVLSWERGVREEKFREGGFHGVIVPARQGAIAVLSTDADRVDAVARQALRALR
jgi:hypothetical protein